MHTDLVIYVFCAIGNMQIRHIPTYCKGCTYTSKSYSNMFRLLHASLIREYTQCSCLVKNICSTVQIKLKWTFKSKLQLGLITLSYKRSRTNCSENLLHTALPTLLLLLLLLLLVFSPWAGLGRDQSSVRRLVWLWYAASWASS